MGQAIMKFGRTKQSEAAASGSVGSTNITNVSATASAATGSTPTVSASLSDTSLTFAFGLVPGEQGEPGITSASASAQSLAEGSAATAQATLTGQALALDFGIPKGDTGNGISGISLISTVGKAKTYRITFTDGSTYDFTVTDGADGTGAGDMTKAVYDTDDDGFVDAVEDTLNPGTGIEFSLDSDGKGQYRASGASQWIPFLSNAYEAIDLSGALAFGTAQSDEFANNSSKTFTLTGLVAGKEYLLIPNQVLGTGTPHMWLGDHTGYTQTFSGATVSEEKTFSMWRFQRLAVTANNPTMTIRNTAGYRNRFETLVVPL